MTTLAHMGGIPEALTVLVPLALVIVMLRVGAKKTPPEDEPAPADSTPASPAPAAPDDPRDPPEPPQPLSPG